MDKTIPSEPADADGGDLTAGDVPGLLDLLFKHRKLVVQDFLRGKGKSRSGTVKDLRTRLLGYVEEGYVQPRELVALLDRVNGWGNQHIYLYKAAPGLIDRWSTEAKARARLRECDKEHLFNAHLPLILPANPRLSAVTWTNGSVRFVWVERRVWREHLPEYDYMAEGIEYTAHRPREARGVVAFDWDLVSGYAALLMQRLPSGEDYPEVKTRFHAELAPLVKIGEFTALSVNSAIVALEKAEDVRHRQLEHATPQGGKITFLSRDRDCGAFDDLALKKAREALGEKLHGCHGNFFLRMPDDAARHVHVKIYTKDHRLGIFGECSEQEVRHVLCCVRQHCC